jgi:hypothetical protein
VRARWGRGASGIVWGFNFGHEKTSNPGGTRARTTQASRVTVPARSEIRR